MFAISDESSPLLQGLLGCLILALLSLLQRLIRARILSTPPTTSAAPGEGPEPLAQGREPLFGHVGRYFLLRRLRPVTVQLGSKLPQFLLFFLII